MDFWDKICGHHQALEVVLPWEKIRSIAPLGSELWLFKEGYCPICLKIEAFLTLFVNPFSKGHNSGLE